jgi:acetyl-CoA synthetase
VWFEILGRLVVPGLYFGKPVLSYYEDGPFDVERALELVGKYGVTNPHFPPTVLRMMMQVDDPAEQDDLDGVRVPNYGSEAVGEELVNWVRRTFGGATLHEAFGQTDANSILGEGESIIETRRGTLGKPLPGHKMTIVDPDTAQPLDEPDTVGEIAVRYEGDPICMKEYFGRPNRPRRRSRTAGCSRRISAPWTRTATSPTTAGRTT